MSIPQIVLYTKPSCCLCEKVRTQLAKLSEKVHFTWREINILEDETAYSKFKHDIPVIYVNGQQAFKHHLDEKRLIQLLKQVENNVTVNSAAPRP